MRQVRAGGLLCSFVCASLQALAVLGLLPACVSPPDHPDWIHAGVTTKDEVITRYGQPDWVIASPGGDTAVYPQPFSDHPPHGSKFPPPRQAPSEQQQQACNRSILA